MLSRRMHYADFCVAVATSFGRGSALIGLNGLPPSELAMSRVVRQSP